MPIYEFECPLGHRRERIFYVNECPNSVECHTAIEEVYCSLKAERVWSAPANIQIGKPTKVFLNPRTGATQIATSEHEKAPRGFVTRELSGPIERSRFEKEEQRKLDVTNEIVTHQLDAQKEETRKNRQADTLSNLSKLAAESDNPAGAEHLIKKALERTRRKKRITERPRRSEVHLAVNHQDSSNIGEVK